MITSPAEHRIWGIEAALPAAISSVIATRSAKFDHLGVLAMTFAEAGGAFVQALNHSNEPALSA